MANFKVKTGLFQPTREYVSSEANDMLSPNEGVHGVVHKLA
jgi:hypothetical protein